MAERFERRTRKWREVRVEHLRDGGSTAACVSGTGRGGTWDVGWDTTRHGIGAGPAEVAVGPGPRPDLTVPCRPLLPLGVSQAGMWRRGGTAGRDLRAGPRHPGQERPVRRKACGERETWCRSRGVPIPVPRRTGPELARGGVPVREMCRRCSGGFCCPVRQRPRPSSFCSV